MNGRNVTISIALALLGCSLPRSLAGPTLKVMPGGERHAELIDMLITGFEQSDPEFVLERVEVTAGNSLNCLVDQTCDVAIHRRLPTETELRLVDRAGAALVGTPIAQEGVIVYVHPYNPVSALSLEEIDLIVTGRVLGWEQLGVPSDRKIHLIRPDETLGYDEAIIRNATRGSAIMRPLETLDSSRGVAEAVAARQTTVGFGGVVQNPTARVVSITRERTAPPVEPTLDTIRSREYPLTQYVYLYTRDEPTGASREFIKFILQPDAQRMIEQTNLGFATVLPSPSAGNDAD